MGEIKNNDEEDDDDEWGEEEDHTQGKITLACLQTSGLSRAIWRAIKTENMLLCQYTCVI